MRINETGCLRLLEEHHGEGSVLGVGGNFTILSLIASQPRPSWPFAWTLAVASCLVFYLWYFLPWVYLMLLQSFDKHPCQEPGTVFGIFQEADRKDKHVQMFANSERSYKGPGCQGGSTDSFCFWEGNNISLHMRGHI